MSSRSIFLLTTTVLSIQPTLTETDMGQTINTCLQVLKLWRTCLKSSVIVVIRHNLSTLGLCPCLVDVEVLDQKSNETVMVSAGIEACICEVHHQTIPLN